MITDILGIVITKLEKMISVLLLEILSINLEKENLTYIINIKSVMHAIYCIYLNERLLQ